MPDRRTRRARLRVALAALAALGAIAAFPSARAVAQSIPDHLTDQQFWTMIADFSEPNGYFHSDNLVSNETAFQWVIPALQRTIQPGGVYLGVGPDQNFTYIAALKPRISFIVDIRRGDLQELLMYKALIALAADRADFLSLLFSRPRPPGLDTASTADAILTALYTRSAPDRAMYAKTLAAIKDQLVNVHGWTLTAEDAEGIEYVFNAFYAAGPWLTYTNNGGGGLPGMPGYADLQMESDGLGVQRSYTATEANFRTLKDLEARNLIVPLVGNFAGPKALRAVAQYLVTTHATVSAIYVSNVEQYLFMQGDDWSRYYTNVATLPIDSASVFIRSIPAGMGGPIQYRGQASSALCSVAALDKAFAAGAIRGYYDVIQMCR